MKILDRYLLINFIQPLIYCLILFLFLYVVIDLFENIDDMIKQHTDFYTIFLYYISFIPTIFVQTTPAAVLVATIYSLGNFNKNNEITAMRSCGISLLKIISPLLVIGFIMSILVFIINDKIATKALILNQTLREEKIKKSLQKDKKKIIDNLALYGTKNRIIFVRSFNINEKKLSEVIIHESDESANLIGKISAEEAIWVDGKWLFKNGAIWKLGNRGEMIGEPEIFTEKIIDMDETPEELEKRESRAEFMNYGELRNYIKQFPKGSFKTLKNLEVELNNKIAFPFTSFVVIIAASPFALISRRGGALIGIGMSLLMGLAYYGLMSISLAFGKSGYLPPLIAAHFANIFFIALGLYLIKKIR